MKKIETYIVTGALGHLGSVIVSDLIKMGKKVRGFDLKNVKHNNLLEDIEMVYGDITNKEDVERLFANLTGDIYVIHSAAIVSISSFKDKRVYNVNVNGVKNIVDASISHKVKKFVYISSVHALPEGKKGSLIKEVEHFDPDLVVGTYAKTKAIAGEYVLDSIPKGLNACIVHPSGIIGPYDKGNGHLTRLFIDYLNGKLTAIVDGGYDFVDVRDVSIGTINALLKGEVGKCYILTNRYVTIKELLGIAAKVSGNKEVKTVLPIWFAKSTAFLSEIYYKIRKIPPLYTSYSLYTLKANANFSHELATKELDYNPRNIEDTVKDMIDFIKENNLK